MSTATQTTATKAALSAFLRMHSAVKLQVETCQGMILLSFDTTESTNTDRKHTTICIGDHDGEDVAFDVSCRGITDYVRSVNTKDTIVFTVDAGSRQLNVDSDTVGLFHFESIDEKGAEPESLRVFEKLGEFKFTIASGDVKIASSIVDRTDQESSRYALGGVLFDDGQVIATDGRRLVMMKTEGKCAETALVHSDVIQYAAKFKYDIDVFDECFIAGDIVVTKMDGRYPTWRQVIPSKLDSVTVISGDELRKLANGHIARNKAAGIEDEWGVEIQLDDVIAKLDSRFIKAAVGKLKSISMAHAGVGGKEKKELTGPVVLTSDELPGWQEVIMPMARDR